MNRIENIIKNLDKNLKHYAVFDCDDTIIKGDVERLTIRYQLEKKEYRVDLEHIKKKLNKYEDFKDEIYNLELNEKFIELTSKIYLKHNKDITNLLLEGYTPNEVYNITKTALEYYSKDFSKKIQMENLFNLLRENNIEIYICSASMLYEVYVVADMYGIKRENVMAINIEIDENGILTGNEIGMPTRNIGKVDAIKSLNYNHPPVLIAGDSDGDYYMMTRLNALHNMIINPKDNTKIKCLIDNYKYFEYID